MTKAFTSVLIHQLGLKIALILLALAVLLPFSTTKALAYDRNAATRYAENNVYSRNLFYPSYGNDCTNFASQALAAGSYQQVRGDGNASSDYNWFGYRDSNYNFAHSNSWTVANDLYNFQINYYPGGWLEATTSYTTSTEVYFSHYDNSNMIQGDLVFYSWDGGPIMDHVGIQVGTFYSNFYPAGQPWYGDTVDYHTNDRQHVGWNLLEVNAQWQTTLIKEVHIDDRN